MVKRYLLHDLLFGLSVVVSILAFFNNMGTVAGSSSVTLTPWLEQLHINFEVEREEGVISRRHLLDCIRENMVTGFEVPVGKLAFSQPTAKGRALAAAYTGTARFLVYS